MKNKIACCRNFYNDRWIETSSVLVMEDAIHFTGPRTQAVLRFLEEIGSEALISLVEVQASSGSSKLVRVYYWKNEEVDRMKGYKSDGEWVLSVEYPASLLSGRDEELEDKLDKLSGTSGGEVRQSWERTCYDRGVRQILYSYPTLELAMKYASRLESVPGVVSVDVYDIRYPNG